MLVKFSTDSQFDFDSDFYDDARFYFKTVALHEIGNLFIGGDHNIDTLACETYPNDCKTSALVHTYPKRVVTSITSCDASKITEIYNFPYTVAYKNDFGETANLSYMYIDNEYTPLDNDGDSETWYAFDGTKTLEAIDQEVNDRYRLFDNWNTGWDNDKEIELPKSSATYTSYFLKRYDIRFYNGSVVIDGNTYQSGQIYYHKENEQYSATANPKTENGLYCVFSSWKEGTSTYSTSNPGTFSQNGEIDYTIEYSGVKPVWSNRNLHTDSDPGDYIHLIWNEHPCSDVNYKIYRKIKHNGIMGSEYYCATVNHGTTDWTDIIQIADGQTTDLAFYDVRAFYTPNSTESDDYFDCIDYTWTEQSIEQIDENEAKDYMALEADENALAKEEVVPNETTLGNYPNPFNPATVISYRLAVESKVLLKVYDMLGKEVATLVNETKPAGSYNVSFNASHLPSGVYIYTLQTNSQAITRKMLLMK